MAKTILLADDSVTIQKVVELTFMDEDYHVVATGDGATALEQVPELDPDLVIADVHMPGADGYEVCRQTKATHPTIPVLLLVGTFEQFDEQRAAEVRADGHLKKPFDSQDLLSQVETLISRSAKAAGTPEPAAAEAPAPAAAAEPDVFELDDSPPPVGDHQVGIGLRHLLERRSAVAGGDDMVVLVHEGGLHHLLDRHAIVGK